MQNKTKCTIATPTKQNSPKSDIIKLVKILFERQQVLTALGIRNKHQHFIHGDRVGFFFGSRKTDYTFGEFIASNEHTAHVIDDDGKLFKVSPYSVFAI